MYRVHGREFPGSSYVIRFSLVFDPARKKEERGETGTLLVVTHKHTRRLGSLHQTLPVLDVDRRETHHRLPSLSLTETPTTTTPPPYFSVTVDRVLQGVEGFRDSLEATEGWSNKGLPVGRIRYT